MKRILVIVTVSLLPLFAASRSVLAQGTAFTYQGLLMNNGEPANGHYDLRFTLYDQASNGTAQAAPIETNGVPVTNGVFTVRLDFGSSVFTGAQRWLEVAVKNSLTDNLPLILSPRQPVTPTPYAINAANLMNLDNAPLDIKVNGQRALRLEPTARGEPNVIGGSASNRVAAGYAGATIGGGHANVIVGDYATVGGGRFNSSSGFGSTISGGDRNQASGEKATVGGGDGNWAGYEASTIAGGAGNTTRGDYSTIGGGSGNIAGDGGHATVGGGYSNHSTAPAATIGGGGYNTAGGLWAVIGGGLGNAVAQDAPFATISGGDSNRIGSTAYTSTIGGGAGNIIEGPTGGTTIAGGVQNHIQDEASGSTVSGGWYNFVGNNAGNASIGGGWSNQITASSATISGGDNNTVLYPGPRCRHRRRPRQLRQQLYRHYWRRRG